jgi:hypothetical protein
MRAVFTVDGELWGTMDLSREAGHPDFAPREVALLRRLAPHLGVALKAAALRLQAPPAQNDADVPGVLILDQRGRVVQHTRAAERWLQELEDLGDGWREGIGLPAAVRMVCGALRRGLKPQTDRDENSIPRLHLRGRSGRWLTFYGSFTESAPGHPAETMIVIEPAKPEEVA